ncbi:MAG: hypothetical protein MI807_07670 [Verrucomicrobiales bacterium]|nr:hypothetical protein [Verrucomicrobiales bacterium]
MKDSEDVQRLIRLKRYETPGEEYFQQFAEDFKERQRAEMLQQSSRSILAERVSLWIEEMGSAKWLVPTGAAAAVGAGLFFAVSGTDKNVTPASSIADRADGIVDLPSFPESSNEVIQLKIPRTTPPALEGSIIPASVKGALREL